VIIDRYQRLIELGEPYDEELEFVTARKRKIWVRAVGEPVINSEGKVVKVRGLFQDIDEQKKRELALEASLAVINKQADKLKDFAHIVSHNLRSHTGNLKMIANMIELEEEPELKLEWIEHIKNLSESLDETVNNLRDIVNSHVGVQEDKKQIKFSEVYDNVVKALALKIDTESIQLNADFSDCAYIDYVPAYLESILLNLLTNAIKYRHSERTPVINIKTFFENSYTYLEVSDNGIGIDMEKYGSRLFKMNETFHNNTDARGIGLYITKNQIEKMGGCIQAISEIDKGTTFRIKF
jgi:signal transduction histidine kinase